MIYLIAGISLLFILTGLILNENNAQYLLSGYNTMSEEERKNIDIVPFVKYFRRFHLFLGISFLLGGSYLIFFVSREAGGVFLGVYPILAYIFFIWHSQRYSRGMNQSGHRTGIYILFITLVFIGVIYARGLKQNDLLIKEDLVQITGSYGEKIEISEIESLSLVNELPGIRIKTNGFAVEPGKGLFQNRKGGDCKAYNKLRFWTIPPY
ncbi:MAG: DUF3784 domain-containing protein [Bacteroidales bacterium]